MLRLWPPHLTSLGKFLRSRNCSLNYKTRKLSIVSINTENRTSFIKESSIYIANINRALKNIKSEIMADFIQLDKRDIIITTNCYDLKNLVLFKRKNLI